MSALESSSGLPGKEYAKDAEAESDHHLHVRAACAMVAANWSPIWVLPYSLRIVRA